MENESKEGFDETAITVTTVENPVKEEDKIPLKEMFVYGAADLFGGGQATLIAVLMLAYFTDIVGIHAWLAGLVILIAKLWQAISDPIFGVITDNTRSKFGRRKPYLFIGGVLIIPAMLFLFAPVRSIPTEAGKTLFMAVAYVIYCTVSTISQVPYTSLSSDISPDHRERNKANFIKLVFDMVAAALCYLVPSQLFERYKRGEIDYVVFYLGIALVFGALFAVPLILASIKVKERCPYPAEKSKFDIREWGKMLKIRSYRYHILMYVTAYLCMDIISAVALYYVFTVMRGVQIFGMNFSSAFVVAPMMVCAGATVLLIQKLIQTHTKQFGFRIGLPLYIVGAVMLALYQPSWNAPWLVTLFAMLMGVGLGGAQMMPWLIFPDTIEVAELKLGYRPVGACSGIMTFSRKFATAITIQIIGIVLSAAGYIEFNGDDMTKAPIQPDTAVMAVRLIMGISVTVLISLAIFISFKYKVTNEKLVRIRTFNEKARENAILTDSEKSEKDALIGELV
ncbi:MAG: MFS transporter [Christensenellaceae bacterium]|jgi:GPH family glycoside/pentoside/hexuronide:cation symporter/oligogalacturonide transporter|nr:MFS transporter [Christensenellaceae bacterium]